MGIGVGIDYGLKRIGISISDPDKKIATSLTTIPTRSFFSFIDDLMLKYNIDFFVLGDPISLNGEKNLISNHINAVIKKIKKKYPQVDVNSIDERFTSKIAKQVIRQSGINRKKRRDKNLIDKISATIILQDFLDRCI